MNNFLLSMTGFGRGQAAAEGRTWVVELRSVNHRFCDIKIKLPPKYAGLEERVKKEVQRFHRRGHVMVTATLSGALAENVHLVPNLPLAREYRHCLQRIKEELSLSDPPTLAMLKDFKELIIAEEAEEDLDAAWPLLARALTEALEHAAAMRRREGRALRHELLTRLEAFSATIHRLEEQVPELMAQRRQKLKERLDNLLDGVDIDPVRLAQEVAIMADKSDVTEELVRLRSHINQFTAYLDSKEPAGRRLDFLLQEFLREINTLASKISDATVAHQAVELKNEVEKLREQVQNLE